MRSVLGALFVASAASFTAGIPSLRSARAVHNAPMTMGFFDDALAAAKEAVREVSVQHILVDSQSQAFAIYDSIMEEGATPEVVGRYAQTKSTCGSSKKKPDANLSQLRGQPGELKFRRGSMAPEFEDNAFMAEPGTLVKPFRTQFGWHVMLVNE